VCYYAPRAQPGLHSGICCTCALATFAVSAILPFASVDIQHVNEQYAEVLPPRALHIAQFLDATMKIRASDSLNFYTAQPTQQTPSTSAELPGDNVPAPSPPATPSTLAPAPRAPKKHKLSAVSFNDFNNRLAASDTLVTPDSLGTIPTVSTSTLRTASDRVSRNKLSAASFGDFSVLEKKSSAPEVSSISLRTSQQSQQDVGVLVAKALPPNGAAPYVAGNAASQYTSAATGGQKIPKWRFVCLSLR
jgi:hypothetical protein